MELRLVDVSYCYPDGTQAMDGVSLCIRGGERVALLGANGAGKSTLARHLNGLLLPTHGDVWVGEWNTRGQPVAFLARTVGYAFQNPDDQLFCRTVWEEVAFGPRNLGVSGAALHERVQSALARMELDGREQMNPFDLSWAGRRRVAVASVLAMDPAFLILDEPTAGQDLAGTRLMAGLIDWMNIQGKTVIGITHDMDFCAAHFERIIVLESGRVGLDASLEEGLSRPERLTAAGLRLPQVERLGKALGFPAPVKDNPAFLEVYRRRKEHL
jgi:energy-coupling factor transport system ATP-binding protein